MKYELNKLKKKYPGLVFYKTAKRKNGKILKAGDEIKCLSWTESIIAFDYYNYPLSIDDMKKLGHRPEAKYNKNGFETTVYKSRYKKMKRAIYYSVPFGYMFEDIETIKLTN